MRRRIQAWPAGRLRSSGNEIRCAAEHQSQLMLVGDAWVGGADQSGQIERHGAVDNAPDLSGQIRRVGGQPDATVDEVLRVGDKLVKGGGRDGPNSGEPRPQPRVSPNIAA